MKQARGYNPNSSEINIVRTKQQKFEWKRTVDEGENIVSPNIAPVNSILFFLCALEYVCPIWAPVTLRHIAGIAATRIKWAWVARMPITSPPRQSHATTNHPFYSLLNVGYHHRTHQTPPCCMLLPQFTYRMHCHIHSRPIWIQVPMELPFFPPASLCLVLSDFFFSVTHSHMHTHSNNKKREKILPRRDYGVDRCPTHTHIRSTIVRIFPSCTVHFF